MTNEIKLAPQEKWYERLQRLEESDVRTIPANNGFDLTDAYQSEPRHKEIKINYHK